MWKVTTATKQYVAASRGNRSVLSLGTQKTTEIRPHPRQKTSKESHRGQTLPPQKTGLRHVLRYKIFHSGSARCLCKKGAAGCQTQIWVESQLPVQGNQGGIGSCRTAPTVVKLTRMSVGNGRKTKMLTPIQQELIERIGEDNGENLNGLPVRGGVGKKDSCHK